MRDHYQGPCAREHALEGPGKILWVERGEALIENDEVGVLE